MEGLITGIIDSGDASCGDPAYDFGRLLHRGLVERDLAYGTSVLEAVLEHYGPAPWLEKDLAGRVLVSAVVFILWSMKGELTGGARWPPWWPAQVNALSTVLDELGDR